MFDLRTLVLAVVVTTASVVVGLLLTTSPGRRDGLRALLVSLVAQILSGALIAQRARVPFAVGHGLANALGGLGFAFLMECMLEASGRTLRRRWHLLASLVLGVGTLLSEGHEAARLAAVNAGFAVLWGYLLYLALRLPDGARSSARSLLALGFGVHGALNVTRTLAALGLWGSPLLLSAPGPLAYFTTLAFLTGTLGYTVAFMLLYRERGESALESLRENLEERVATQVAQLTAHAREVDKLNDDLRKRVRERSEELSRALARVALRRQTTGISAGTTLGERYVLQTLLGQGGMGVVYRALDRATGERVAVKVVGATSASQLDAMRAFLREARASAAVSHPGIVFARHLDVSHGQLYLVFEWVEGSTLAEALEARGKLDGATAAALGADLAASLEAAHAEGVVHRDLKPTNVMLARKGSPVRILDFGIARLRDSVFEEGAATHAGGALGTPAYMAPEQALDERLAGAPADVYSLGVVLFEALSGALPFAAGNLATQLLERVSRPAPSLLDAAPQTPEPLARLVDRCLSREPSARPSAKEVAASLRALAASLGGTEESLRALASLGTSAAFLALAEKPTTREDLAATHATPRARP